MVRARGFSLLELMATISIATIVVTLGTPAFRAMIGNSRLSAQTNELVAALSLARSEAIKRGLTVTVCRSSSTAAASPVCGGNGGWEAGWIVFAEQAGDLGTFNASGKSYAAGAALKSTVLTATDAYPAGDDSHPAITTLADDLIQRRAGPLAGGNTLVGNNNVLRRVSFDQNGLAHGSNGTLTLRDARRSTHARCIYIATSGRTRVLAFGGSGSFSGSCPSP